MQLDSLQVWRALPACRRSAACSVHGIPAPQLQLHLRVLQLTPDVAIGFPLLAAGSLSTYFEIVPPCPPTSAPFMTHVWQVRLGSQLGSWCPCSALIACLPQHLVACLQPRSRTCARRSRQSFDSLPGLATTHPPTHPSMLVQELSGAMYLPSGQFDQQQMSAGNDLALGVPQGNRHPFLRLSFDLGFLAPNANITKATLYLHLIRTGGMVPLAASVPIDMWDASKSFAASCTGTACPSTPVDPAVPCVAPSCAAAVKVREPAAALLLHSLCGARQPLQCSLPPRSLPRLPTAPPRMQVGSGSFKPDTQTGRYLQLPLNAAWVTQHVSGRRTLQVALTMPLALPEGAPHSTAAFKSAGSPAAPFLVLQAQCGGALQRSG